MQKPVTKSKTKPVKIIGFRPSPGIRDKLNEARKEAHRNLSQEINHRLEKSFEE